jgi:hypothetical protein
MSLLIKMGALSDIAKVLFPARELYLVSEVRMAVSTDRLTDVLNKAGAKDANILVSREVDSTLHIRAFAWLKPDCVGYIESNGFTVKPVGQELTPNQP